MIFEIPVKLVFVWDHLLVCYLICPDKGTNVYVRCACEATRSISLLSLTLSLLQLSLSYLTGFTKRFQMTASLGEVVGHVSD